jgi:hypothetical protein
VDNNKLLFIFNLLTKLYDSGESAELPVHEFWTIFAQS